jgi:hypothetical protein
MQRTANFKLIVFILFGISLDLIIHPLTHGPDRLIHDPAVNYYLSPSVNMDWYTSVAVSSHIYLAYSYVIGAGQYLLGCTEKWRAILYVFSLCANYLAIAKISKLLSGGLAVASVLVIIHTAFFQVFGNPWVYGQFLQIDGGLAPRSISNAAGFWGLYLFLANRYHRGAILLGLATFIHPSNTLLIYTLLIISMTLCSLTHKSWNIKDTIRTSIINTIIYIFCGGWFAFAVYLYTSSTAEISGHFLMWVWLYIRAPYMLYVNNRASDIILPFLTCIISCGCYFYLKLLQDTLQFHQHQSKNLQFLFYISILSFLGFFIYQINAYYLYSLTLFKSYSIRLLNYGYLASFLLISFTIKELWVSYIKTCLKTVSLCKKYLYILGLLIVFIGLVIAFNNNKLIYAKLCSQNSEINVINFIKRKDLSFLGPPNFNHSWIYLNQAITFKSFGFTDESIFEWANRISFSKNCDLKNIYENQLKVGKFKTPNINFDNCYNNLTVGELKKIANRLNISYALVYDEMTGLGNVVYKDQNFVLYRIIDD